MKVAKYYNNKDVRIEQISKPTINPDEFLVKIRKSGICGSDILEYYRFAKMKKLGVDNLILGHEIAGDIVEIGNNVKEFKIGDRVFVSHHVPCFNCHFCKQGHHTACHLLHNTNFDPGGFSEYVRIPSINIEKKGVYVFNESMSYEDGVMLEPLACVCRAQRLANIKEGQTILILGSGVSGILHLKLAKMKGAAKVIMTDISENRLKQAQKYGANEIINANEDIFSIIKNLNEDRMPDSIIVCTGALTAANQALKCVGAGSTILFFAVPKPGINLDIPINDYWRNEVIIMTSYGAAPPDLDEAYELISNKKINVSDIISHRFPLNKVQEAFNMVCNADNSLKVIIDFDMK
ncbi:MAG: alcohol dehydrogenase catalytic domain-containing protein [Candidatus Lokiarchaeota archaeon]|nr:alcohol dehydrogenase catalytic domain-containing protein [Candidatus Lokiarchaeota archaeon]